TNQAIIKQIAVVVSGVLTEDNHYLSGRNDHAAKGSPPATRTATDGNYCYIATVDPARTSTDGNYRDFLYSWAIVHQQAQGDTVITGTVTGGV
ncbi:TPA_asm: hypothetical protein G0G78_27810, partial [Salmonella enterica]|nr:hypothetical protein [Salmonella enterica]HAC8273707.1 hypothetical protein [Salmonella enterica]